jgi:D-methionine transport system substrate-binding protein
MMKTNRKHFSKRLITGFMAMAVIVVMAAACRAPKKTQSEVTVKVGTTSDEPRIWNAVQAELDAKGEKIKIKIVNLADTAPNVHLADGEIDINAFQHYAYFNKNKEDLKLDLTAIGETLIVPLNLFSKKYKSVESLPDKAKIALPDDPTNQGRALNVLKNAGLIELKPSAGNNALLRDIISNPKNISFVEMTGAQIPRSLDDVDAAIINCGYATDAGLDPVNDPIYKDTIDLNNPEQKPFINIIAARTADKDNETYIKIVEAYHSKQVADIIGEVYKKAAIPAFTVR